MIEVFKAVAAHWALSGGLAVLVGLFVWFAVSVGPAWLMAHWSVVLDAVIAIVVLAVCLGLYVALERQRAATAVAQANYQTALGQTRLLQSANDGLAATVVRQSEAASAVAAESAARTKAASDAMAVAVGRQDADRKTIAALRARAADPKINQGTCDDEIANLRAGL